MIIQHIGPAGVILSSPTASSTTILFGLHIRLFKYLFSHHFIFETVTQKYNMNFKQKLSEALDNEEYFFDVWINGHQFYDLSNNQVVALIMEPKWSKSFLSSMSTATPLDNPLDDMENYENSYFKMTIGSWDDNGGEIYASEIEISNGILQSGYVHVGRGWPLPFPAEGSAITQKGLAEVIKVALS